MTESQEIEEILFEAHAYGLRHEVMEWARKTILKNPNMRKVDAYHIAFNELVK